MEVLPRKINSTEARQLTLLLLLKKYASGLTQKKIFSLMKNEFSNENEDSDRKKLQRDIKDLSDLGFPVRYVRQSEFSEEGIYRLLSEEKERKLEFTEDELDILSQGIIRELSVSNSAELYTAAQKIFHNKISYFPKIDLNTELKPSEENLPAVLNSILHSIRNRIPLQIVYQGSFGKDAQKKFIDPIKIIKRNSRDFYLIAYDREKKEKRKYLIPKILKASETPDEFIFSGRLKTEDENYHALSFSVHEEITLRLKCREEDMWKLENFLCPHPFTKNGNAVELKTTNQGALFPFLWKEQGTVISVNSAEFIENCRAFISRMQSRYRSLQK